MLGAVAKIVFLACLSGNPQECKEGELFVESSFACVIQAQALLAKWVVDHPKYQIKEWKCGSGRPT